jgi:hypothetical protein
MERELPTHAARKKMLDSALPKGANIYRGRKRPNGLLPTGNA